MMKAVQKKIERANSKCQARINFKKYLGGNEQEESTGTLDDIPEEIIKTLNIVNKGYCKHWGGERITPFHLMTDHSILLPNTIIEQDFAAAVKIRKELKNGEEEHERLKEKYSVITIYYKDLPKRVSRAFVLLIERIMFLRKNFILFSSN